MRPPAGPFDDVGCAELPEEACGNAADEFETRRFGVLKSGGQDHSQGLGTRLGDIDPDVGVGAARTRTRSQLDHSPTGRDTAASSIGLSSAQRPGPAPRMRSPQPRPRGPRLSPSSVHPRIGHSRRDETILSRCVDERMPEPSHPRPNIRRSQGQIEGEASRRHALCILRRHFPGFPRDMLTTVPSSCPRPPDTMPGIGKPIGRAPKTSKPPARIRGH